MMKFKLKYENYLLKDIKEDDRYRAFGYRIIFPAQIMNRSKPDSNRTAVIPFTNQSGTFLH